MADLHLSQQTESCRPHYYLTLGLLPAVTQAPLSVTFSYYIAHHNPLYLCVCASRDGEGRGVGAQGDFTVSLRIIPLLMHLSTLCFTNEDQSAGGRQKEDEMEGGKKNE